MYVYFWGKEFSISHSLHLQLISFHIFAFNQLQLYLFIYIFSSLVVMQKLQQFLHFFSLNLLLLLTSRVPSLTNQETNHLFSIGEKSMCLAGAYNFWCYNHFFHWHFRMVKGCGWILFCLIDNSSTNTRLLCQSIIIIRCCHNF